MSAPPAERRSVVLAGWAETRRGIFPDLPLRDLITSAARPALTAAGRDDVDLLITASAATGLLTGQRMLAELTRDHLRLSTDRAWHIEAGLATGGLALAHAIEQLRAGVVRSALIVGVEQVSQADPQRLLEAQWSFTDVALEAEQGATPAMQHALVARTYAQRYDVDASFTPLAKWATKRAIHSATAASNGDRALQRPNPAHPLTALDFASPVDGAAAVVLTSDAARDTVDQAQIHVAGSGVARDRFRLGARADLLDWRALPDAHAQAADEAGWSIHDAQLAEIADPSTLALIVSSEMLALIPQGRGLADWATRNPAQLGRAEAPIVNPTGGALGGGDTWGASGIAQLARAADQLAGNVGPAQLPDVTRAATVSIGGIASVATCLLLERSQATGQS